MRRKPSIGLALLLVYLLSLEDKLSYNSSLPVPKKGPHAAPSEQTLKVCSTQGKFQPRIGQEIKSFHVSIRQLIHAYSNMSWMAQRTYKMRAYAVTQANTIQFRDEDAKY